MHFALLHSVYIEYFIIYTRYKHNYYVILLSVHDKNTTATFEESLSEISFFKANLHVTTVVSVVCDCLCGVLLIQ